VITRSEMIEYHDVSGCYILRPWSYFIWQEISAWLDSRIRQLGVENAYFPCFVSKEALETEENHIEGFAPEVAWVTKSGSSELAKPVAVRPTSETIMYPAFAKWIRSHRDLPLRLNQWANIVRWEFKQVTPLLRSREFLWQEGHTAHATRDEAAAMMMEVLGLYATLYEELLAIPVIRGMKSEAERFAGGQQTATLEAFVPGSGRCVQAATSHLLGDNFAKMFDISFEDAGGQAKFVEQTCWGLTTRSLGVMVMVHGDDAGLVLPPRVAPTQVILIPISLGKSEAAGTAEDICADLCGQLSAAGVRAKVDARRNYTAGWKYNWWEMKGVPVRLEVGPRDVERRTCRLVRRDTGEKKDCGQSDIVSAVSGELNDIHDCMLRKAREERDARIVRVTEWSQVMPALNGSKLILAPWCETAESEEAIRKATKEASAAAIEDASAGDSAAPALSGAMKSLCIPLEQPQLSPGTACFFTGAPARRWCLFGRSY